MGSSPASRYFQHRFPMAQISSAVSTVLHAQKCAATDAAEVEHCGYGDLY
jgi:hypothetical protein